MIFVIGIFIFNILTAFLLSKNDNLFRTSENNIRNEFTSLFLENSVLVEKVYRLNQKNKYVFELYLFYVVFFLIIVINFALAYININYLHFDADNLIESCFKLFFIEFIIINATALIFNKFKESFLNSKKIKVGDFYQAYLDEKQVVFPFLTLEGSVASEIARTNSIYISLPLDQIEEFIVEKSLRVSSVRGSTYTPPYYKIKMKNKQSYVYVMRTYFDQLEKRFIEDLQNKLVIKITMNDKLNGK